MPTVTDAMPAVLDNPSNSTPSNLHILRRLIERNAPVHTLEVGLAYGASAVAILEALHERWGDEGVYSHTAIDPYQDAPEQGRHEGISAVERIGQQNQFACLLESSQLALPKLLDEGRRFDLIYVDGAHRFEFVMRDVLYSCELLAVGGIMVCDDCLIPDVRKALRFVRRNLDTVREIDLAPYRPRATLARRVAHRIGYTQARAFRRVREIDRREVAPDGAAKFHDF